MNNVLKLNSYLKKLEEFIISTCILIMAVILVANVIGRICFQHSLTFAEEVCSVLAIMVTFTGTSYCARMSCHISMTAVVDILPFHGKKIAMVIVSIVTAASMLFLSYQAIRYVISLQASGRFTPSLHIPMWIPYLVVPLGLILTAVQYLITLGLNIQNRDHLYIGIEQVVDETVDMSDEAIAGVSNADANAGADEGGTDI